MGQRTTNRAFYDQGKWKRRSQRSYHSRRDPPLKKLPPKRQNPDEKRREAARKREFNRIAQKAAREYELNRLYLEFATKPGKFCHQNCGCSATRKAPDSPAREQRSTRPPSDREQ